MNWTLAAGSLAAVLVLAGIAWALKLGGGGRITDPAHAVRLAEEALAGFEARDAVVCGAGAGAVVFGVGGTIALIRPSGARFIVREVRRPAWRATADGLAVETGDRLPVQLQLECAQAEQLGARLDMAADMDVNNMRA